MNRRTLLACLSGLPFVRFQVQSQNENVPIIIPEGIVLKTGIGIGKTDKHVSRKNLRISLYNIRSTDVEDIRRKIICDIDRTIYAHLENNGYTVEAYQYLANRNDPELTKFCEKYLK